MLRLPPAEGRRNERSERTGHGTDAGGDETDTREEETDARDATNDETDNGSSSAEVLAAGGVGACISLRSGDPDGLRRRRYVRGYDYNGADRICFGR